MRLAYLRHQGCLVQPNSGRLLLALTITLLVLCFAIKSAKFDLDLNNWIQKSSSIEAELSYISQTNGPAAGSNSELIIQTPTSNQHNSKNGVLNVDAMMIHLEAMAIASHISVDLFDVTWTLRDICFRPTLPNIEGYDITLLLDKIMPCSIKTPLDCFWEGARLHGPNDMMTGPQAFGLKKWTELDPVAVIESLQRNRPHSAVDYQSLLDWMKRVGIKHGYQRKPCLDPTDPNCPDTAPNKQSKTKPNIGQYLTGGCYGVAENQMHWREEEIVGGSVKNKTGFITKANAIQSSISLMCEQDLYDYWSKTSQTLDISNWSVDKAKTILETWEQRFKDELDQFTKSLLPSQSSQKIHSISSKSMLEPMDVAILLDYTNFLLSFSLMTLITCISFPRFKFNLSPSNNNNCSQQDTNNKISKQTKRERQENKSETGSGEVEEEVIFIELFDVIQLALASSILVGLTFVASLGLCSFMNLPFNMATTQLLPPLALYYGFNQLNSIVNIYSQKFGSVPINDLTTSCLTEIFPIITTELKTYLIALLVATIIPVPATRSLALQAISHILLATFVALVLLPAIMTHFLLKQYYKHVNYEEEEDEEEEEEECDEEAVEEEQKDESDKKSKISNVKSKSGNSVKKTSGKGNNDSKVSSNKNKSAKQSKSDNNSVVDIDKIFSRIQDDLKNIQVDSRNTTPTNLCHTNVTLNLETSFNSIRTPRSPSTNQSIDPYLASKTGLNNNLSRVSPLPDLISNTLHHYPHPSEKDYLDVQSKMNDCGASTISECSTVDIKDFEEMKKHKSDSIDCDNNLDDIEENRGSNSFFNFLIKNIISNKYARILIFLIKLALLIQLLPYAQQVKFGLQLKDIVAQGTEQYDTISAQEKYFSIYNIFTVTKGNFDYPANQKLLHDYYKSLSNAEGIVKDKNVNRFWLIAFRDWLLDLQHKFDVDRSKSLISSGGWTEEASEAAKLAYRLLAQTGRVDNPIDTSLINSARLVDSNGIINQKTFYHYLTAWVSCDAFVYATTEANFKPEPKIMKEDTTNLRIEKARPLTYAQIPFLMKLSHNEDNVKMISKIRSISRTFEQLNLPNFPTGIPFIFWDQFMNLDSLTFMAIIIVIISIFLIILEMTSEFNTAAIMTLPMGLTMVELYCFIGLLRIPFNNILAVLLVSSIGIMIGQSVHYVTYFASIEGDSRLTRIDVTVRRRFTVIITNLTLLFVCAVVFLISRIDFLINYSYLLLALFQSNLLNSLLITPILLSLFGSSYKPNDHNCAEQNESTKNHPRKSVKRSSSSSSSSLKTSRSSSRDKAKGASGSKNQNLSRKGNKNGLKRSKASVNKQILDYQRKVQSEQSLSTISEEP